MSHLIVLLILLSQTWLRQQGLAAVSGSEVVVLAWVGVFSLSFDLRVVKERNVHLLVKFLVGVIVFSVVKHIAFSFLILRLLFIQCLFALRKHWIVVFTTYNLFTSVQVVRLCYSQNIVFTWISRDSFSFHGDELSWFRFTWVTHGNGVTLVVIRWVNWTVIFQTQQGVVLLMISLLEPQRRLRLTHHRLSSSVVRTLRRWKIINLKRLV